MAGQGDGAGRLGGRHGRDHRRPHRPDGRSRAAGRRASSTPEAGSGPALDPEAISVGLFRGDELRRRHRVRAGARRPGPSRDRAGLPGPGPRRTTTAAEVRRMHLLRDVEMGVSVELGRTRMAVRDLLALAPGAIVELDKAAGAPVDVLVNGTLDGPRPGGRHRRGVRGADLRDRHARSKTAGRGSEAVTVTGHADDRRIGGPVLGTLARLVVSLADRPGADVRPRALPQPPSGRHRRRWRWPAGTARRRSGWRSWHGRRSLARRASCVVRVSGQLAAAGGHRVRRVRAPRAGGSRRPTVLDARAHSQAVSPAPCPCCGPPAGPWRARSSRPCASGRSGVADPAAVLRAWLGPGTGRGAPRPRVEQDRDAAAPVGEAGCCVLLALSGLFFCSASPAWPVARRHTPPRRTPAPHTPAMTPMPPCCLAWSARAAAQVPAAGTPHLARDPGRAAYRPRGGDRQPRPRPGQAEPDGQHHPAAHGPLDRARAARCCARRSPRSSSCCP